jgi:hypothetical protein
VSKLQWLLLAAIVGSLLVRNESIAREKAINQAAMELAADGARLSRLIETRRFGRSLDVEAVFEQVRRESRLSIVSIQLRGQDGAIEAVAGLKIDSAFPVEYVKSHSEMRRPVFKVREDPGGKVIVEAFPIRWPVSGNHFRWAQVADTEPAGQLSRVGIIEITARLGPMKARVGSRRKRVVELTI